MRASYSSSSMLQSSCAIARGWQFEFGGEWKVLAAELVRPTAAPPGHICLCVVGVVVTSLAKGLSVHFLLQLFGFK
jgi:hypothetical protein